ncbi:MAG: winged helix-turn-helix domain-containing protein [Halioglobus sp.]
MKPHQLGRIGFDPDASELFSDESKDHLQPQVRNVLVCLINHAGEIVSKEQLVSEAWEGRTVTEACLNRCVSALRRHLQRHGEPHLIEALPGEGYRLSTNTELSLRNTAESPAVRLTDTVQQSLFIRFDSGVLKTVTALSMLGLVIIFVTISVV